MTRLAALDLGSNSFHLLVADQRPRGRISRRATKKLTLRLGEPVARTGALGPEARERASEAFADLLAVARDEGAQQVVAVATEALRMASDGEALRAAFLAEHGVSVQLLSGRDEAALSLRGMTASLALRPGERVLGLDLGGGSYEVAYGGPVEMLEMASLPLGPARLLDQLRDPPRLVELARLHDAALAHLEPAAQKVQARRGEDTGPLRAVGTAGTIRDLGRLGLALAGGAPPSKVRGLLVSRTQMEQALARLCSLPTLERMELPGVSRKRADLLPAGGVVVVATMEAFGLTHLQLCDWGLREGVLLDVVAGGEVIDLDRVVPL